MTGPTVEQLAAQVRGPLEVMVGVLNDESCGDALAALSALQERVEAAERERDQAREMDAGTAEIAKREMARAQRLEDALRDFATHGTRYDTNPTRMVRNDDGWMQADSYWLARSVAMDNAVRERARAALADTPKEGTP